MNTYEEAYMKYAIASESITVDGVRLKLGFNKLTNSQFNKLSRSNFKGRGIYELHDQESEAKEAEKENKVVKKTETIEIPKEDVDIDVDIDVDKVTVVDPEALSYRELVQHAKENDINTKGLNRAKILDALKESK